MESITCDQMSELKAFDDTKAGVKGLVDAGVTSIPRIFIHDQHTKHKLDDLPICCDPKIKIPIIDLHEAIHKDASSRSKMINKLKDACEIWGFFQVINHGIAPSILDEAIAGIRRFFDQDVEVKKQYYSRDYSKKVYYVSNFDLFEAPAACWKDNLNCQMGCHFSSPAELPLACRDTLITYNNEMLKLGSTLFELLSESLGLGPKYLNEMGCAEQLSIAGHYYAACPQPELTMGVRAHADPGFVTVLLQDQIGGLQVLHEDQWLDVVPLPGALVVNIGYLMQVMSNDKYKSVYHRVLSKKVGPRISIAGFFITYSSTPYGPIKELLSEENPPTYRVVSVMEIINSQHSEAKNEHATLDKFKLPNRSG